MGCLVRWYVFKTEGKPPNCFLKRHHHFAFSLAMQYNRFTSLPALAILRVLKCLFLFYFMFISCSFPRKIQEITSAKSCFKNIPLSYQDNSGLGMLSFSISGARSILSPARSPVRPHFQADLHFSQCRKESWLRITSQH